MHFTVFYAWQSDCPNSTNRSFIERAAKDAIDEIKADATLEASPRIDSDTKNVPGTPDIANTILHKIDSCGVFLADVTFTGRTRQRKDGTRKLAPNSNVLFELGYAVKAVDWVRIILVMNDEFGPPDEQIFDLRHRRFPICYRVREGDGEKAEAQAKLTAEIKVRLLQIIESGVLNQQSGIGAAQSRIAEERKRFEGSLRNFSFHRLEGRKGILAVSLIPEDPLAVPIDLREVPFGELRPIYCRSGWRPEYRAHSLIQVEGELNDPRESIVELSDSGTVKAANTSLLNVPLSNFRLEFPKEVKGVLIPESQEGAIVLAVKRYLDLLRKSAVKCPIHVGVSLLKVNQYRLLYPPIGQPIPFSTEAGRVMDQEDIICDPVIVSSTSKASDRGEVGQLLMPAFEYIWKEFGFSACHTGPLHYQ